MHQLVIATGSNLGDSQTSLLTARLKLEELFGPAECSRLYRSAAVDYCDQPDFLNQVLNFKLPAHSAQEVMETLLKIETELGRKRTVKFGPRVIDIDLIFYAEQKCSSSLLILPHPRFLQRSFVVYPLLELSLAEWLKQNFCIPERFDTEAYPLD